jgi:hypothetical protein
MRFSISTATTIVVMAALAGCPKPVQIPATADLDQAPTITLGYLVKALPNDPPGTWQTRSTSGTVGLPTDTLSRDYLLTASADNPRGGVKTLSIALGNAPPITISQAPDSKGLVTPGLSLIGTDGKGGPGPAGIQIPGDTQRTVTVTATNFHDQTSTIVVTFHPVPGPPKVIAFKATPDYMNVGQTSTLSWQVACGPGSEGCNVALRGADGPGYASQVLFLPALTFDGSFPVTPTRSTQTRYTLTVTNAGAEKLAVSQSVVVQLYAPQTGGGNQPFYFEMRGSSSVTSCFTILVLAPDPGTAKKIAESQNGGFSATQIDAQQFADGC